MTEQEQRIAIAEACGLSVKTPGLVKGGWLQEILNDATLPDYLHDLNAMHEAEKTLNAVQRRKLEMELNARCESESDKWHCWHWHLIHATASQRAEAFLRTIGKWKD